MNHESKSAHRSRLVSALAGGWVADAASLGLHWLYDSERILEVGGQTPEFLPPRADYFTKGFGYFAHEGKLAGDVSHYAAATGVLSDSLLANAGALDIRDYQRRFRAFFGPGGQWRGFIDNPTRITLDNLNTIEQTAIEHARATTTAVLTDQQKRVLVQKVLPYTRHLTGDQLADPVRKAISLTYKEPDIQAAGIHLAETIDRELKPESGADDLQLPAVSKLAPLVACYCGDETLMAMTEAAVRVTNHNDEAVAWARCAATLLDGLFRGGSLSEALDAATREAPDPKSLTNACSGTALDGPGAGDAYGRTCYLHEAMPVIFHVLSHARSFTEAVRANIHCGGDSCGRASIIGPAMAALYGVGGERGIPLSWLARVTDAPRIFAGFEAMVNLESSARSQAR
ncbi:ADP-ribosylglycohydrolase family protein [Marinobacter caseinilyticus]|uniref:ADP-ribosylglycohydrolase family protein n=1 Tax=Marinobacter caseinilyticus TaxID=2692195 RepID=UPI00140C3428|nr:ADP-ribosylglycohydrolase family protein [Marinobacter caseinilyticus]